MSNQPLINWCMRVFGETGYLGNQYIGTIYEVGEGRFLMHCILPCEALPETCSPHTSREDAKAFAERRVITSLMAAVRPPEGI